MQDSQQALIAVMLDAVVDDDRERLDAIQEIAEDAEESANNVDGLGDEGGPHGEATASRMWQYIHDQGRQSAPSESAPEKSWLPDLHPLFRFGEDIPSEGDTANG